MAQGSNKSRIIIWSVVGVLVVVAAIMLITKPKDSAASKLVPENFAERKTKELGRLEEKMAEAGLTPDQTAAIEAEIAKAREALTQIDGTTDRVERRKIADAYHAAHSAAKKLLKAATGDESPDEEPTDE